MFHLKQRSAFTLLETVLSLFILLCISILLGLMTQTVLHYRLEDLTPTSDWFLFVEELESSRHSFAVTHVYRQKLNLIDTDDNEKYDLVSGKCLYLRSNRGGYLPILLNYQAGSVVFRKVDRQRVAIRAKTKDGGTYNAIAVFKDPRECNPSQHHFTDPSKCGDPN